MEIVQTKVVVPGKKWDLARNTLRTASGATLERDFVDHPGSVVLLPLLPEDRIVLIRIFRHSVGRILLEVPAGTANRGEPLLETARRELQEETGYLASQWTQLLQFYAAPGLTNERMAIFLAEGLESGPTAREEDEEMNVEIVLVSDALRMARDGRIEDGKTMIALEALARWQASRSCP